MSDHLCEKGYLDDEDVEGMTVSESLKQIQQVQMGPTAVCCVEVDTLLCSIITQNLLNY
jgi:hypothetical protein